MATKLKIAKEVADACKADMEAMGALMGMFGKSQKTIERWIDNGNPSLTGKAPVEFLMQKFGKGESEILVEDLQTA